MIRGALPLLAGWIVLPGLLGADWLVTTHSGNDVLRLDDRSGSLTTLVASSEGGLDQARGITLGPGGELFVCSGGSRDWAVLRYERDGTFRGTFAAGDGLAHPYQSLFGPDGNLYVSGQGNNAVLRFDGTTGRAMGVFVRPGAGGLNNIRGIVFHPDGDLLVAGRDNNAVLRFDGATGKPKGFFVAADTGKLDRPIQIRYGPDGHLYVGSSHHSRVVRFHGRTGKFIDVFVKHKSGGLDHPSGFAWGPDGDLYVASRETSQLLRYNGKTGKFKAVVIDGKDAPAFLRPEFILFLPP